MPINSGGTDDWFSFFKDKKEIIDINQVYDFGTLLLRDCHDDIYDQGHIALVYENTRELKRSKIVHAYSKCNINNDLNGPGVIIEDFAISKRGFRREHIRI
jgi:hypothetical protein